MIIKTGIYNNLTTLNRLYLVSSGPRNSTFYSKLAILELCGWTEVSMDDIVLKCAKRISISGSNMKAINESVKRTWGFEYDYHFIKMLIHIIGYSGVEKVEKSVDRTKHTLLISTLNNLKGIRDSLAHTYLSGVTTRLDAPSITVSNFNNIYAGLKDFNKTLIALGY